MFHFVLNILFSLKDLISKGYAERVPAEDLGRSDGEVWCIYSMVFITPGKESSVLSLIAELNSKGRL